MAADDRRQLFLIDGNSLAYRAFFALPETIATSQGQPTNAIFGFASMLVKILTECGVHPTLVVWDAGMSGRREMSEDYKAQRSSRPDLLAEQFPHLAPLAEAFGYTNVKVPGYEADDVIATLTEQSKAKGLDAIVVTGDRDAFQLIEPGVRVMATSRGITDTKTYDREAVIERYGIPPELIPDFYGLKGDTSDNIPGVPGIGDKTASQLLQRFGDLDTVLASVDEISGAKRKQNLIDHAADARLSKQLATAQRDVPIDLDLDTCFAGEPDRSRLREVFREFELRDPLRRLEEALGEGGAAAPRACAAELLEARAETVLPADLARLEGEHAVLAAERPVDEEGVPAAALAFAAYAGGERVLVGEAETLAAVTLAWGERPVVAHDWKQIAAGAALVGTGAQPAPTPAAAGGPQTLELLAPAAEDRRALGPEGEAGGPPLEHDTMVAAYLLDPTRRQYALDELAEDEGLGAQVEGADGLAERAVVTRALAERQRTAMAERELVRLFEDVELPLVEVLVAIERAGLLLDVGRLAEIGTRFAERVGALERSIWEHAGEEFVIGSPQQLAPILFDKLGLSKKRRGKTGFSTDARVLTAIRDEHAIIREIEEWRELTKLKSTYLDALPQLVDPRTGRLHTTFSQTTATTGRLSSTDPNLQNIPIRTEVGREIRACFVAPSGSRLISADYSQVELRVLAHIAGEEALRDIFARGEDVHTATSAEIFDLPLDRVDKHQRDRAKMVNYGIVYGLSAFGLADRLQIPQAEAQEFIDRYLGRFPRVRDFIRDTISFATNEGHVKTMFGRVRPIPELHASSRQTQQLGERLAVNTVIQGSAADVIKIAMVNCHRRLAEAGLRTRLVLQIHDELLFEAPEEEIPAASEIVRAEMIGAVTLDPPLEVDLGVGRNWLEAK